MASAPPEIKQQNLCSDEPAKFFAVDATVEFEKLTVDKLISPSLFTSPANADGANNKGFYLYLAGKNPHLSAVKMNLC